MIKQTIATPQPEEPLESALTRNDAPMIHAYDFLDFGCSTGANITHVNSTLPGFRGLGIDIDASKIEKARENGHDAIVFDILKLPNRKSVDFVTMAHFLEHLPGLANARQMLSKAISVSRDFVLIRQPWFDSDGALLRMGLKFYWSHWSGHPNKMTTLDFHSILSEELERQRINGFSIYGRGTVKSSKHPSLLPLNTPKNQHQYDESLHGAKPIGPLSFTAFKEIVVKVDVSTHGKADPLMARLAPLELILSSEDAS